MTRTTKGRNDTARSPRNARFARMSRSASRVIGQKRAWWSGERAS